jgi:hypothetical protein
MTIRFFAVLSASVGFATICQAQVEQDEADARCMIAIVDRADNPRPDEAKIGDEKLREMEFFVGYFLGKIRGRGTTGAIDTLVTADMIRSVRLVRPTEFARCAAEVRSIATDMGLIDAVHREMGK